MLGPKTKSPGVRPAHSPVLSGTVVAMLTRWWVAKKRRIPEGGRLRPQECAACGAPPTDWLPLPGEKSLLVPYCAPCARRARQNPWVETFAVTALAFVVALVATTIPFAPTIGGGPWVVLLAAAVVGTVVQLARRPGVAARFGRVMPEVEIWVRRLEFARKVTKLPVKRRRFRLDERFATVVFAFLAGGIGISAGIWLTTTELAIDDGTSESVHVSVDGDTFDVESDHQLLLYVRRGRHHVAWRGGGTEGARDVDVRRNEPVLLSPGPRHCYQLAVALYGPEWKTKPTADERRILAESGPLPIVELQVVPMVDRFFYDNPSAKKQEEGSADRAVLRDPRCQPLVDGRCPQGVLDDWRACVRAATDPSQVGPCRETALARCTTTLK